ncbi:MAG: NAD(P)-binding domain-containing protein [Ignavibacteriales bacterium]|nr:NAD(P)-binding domain-containing protein [Ignavibacteriales bacterium]
MKKIGILGSGFVGQALGNGFLKHGYEVMLGTSKLEKLSDWKKNTGDKGLIGTFQEAAAFGELVVLAVKGTAALNAIQQANPSQLANKTVIDTTNPIAEAPPENGVLKFFTSLDDSLLERLQKTYPAIHFVKAFSCIGSAFMVNPNFPGGKPTMFFCGNDETAKAEVKAILDQFGLDPADMGKAESARAIEPLCMLWCIPGFQHNEWTHAFKLLKLS